MVTPIKNDKHIDIVLSLPCDVDVELVKKKIISIMQKDVRTLKCRRVFVKISESRDYNLSFMARLWVSREDYWELRYDLIQEFKKELTIENIV